MTTRTFLSKYGGWILAGVLLVIVAFFAIRTVANSEPASQPADVSYTVGESEVTASKQTYDAEGCAIYPDAVRTGFNAAGECQYVLEDGNVYEELPADFARIPLATPMAPNALSDDAAALNNASVTVGPETDGKPTMTAIIPAEPDNGNTAEFCSALAAQRGGEGGDLNGVTLLKSSIDLGYTYCTFALPISDPADTSRAATVTNLEVSANEDNYSADIVMVALPGDMTSWVDAQVYEAPNSCDPKTYSENAWWIESTSKDGSNFDGGNGATWDIGLYDIQKWSRAETLVAWGDEVTIDGVEYGQALVAVTNNRHEVYVKNGGYRIGLDMGNAFPLYWSRVLNCLYPHAPWTPVIVE